MIVLAALGGVHLGGGALGARRAGLLAGQQHGLQRVQLGVLHAAAGAVGVIVGAVLGGVHLHIVAGGVAQVHRLCAGICPGDPGDAALDAHVALGLAEHHRLGQRDLFGAAHALAVLVGVVRLASAGAVDQRARGGTAGRAGLLPRQQRVLQRALGGVLHARAVGLHVEVGAVLGGVHLYAALVHRLVVDQHGHHVVALIQGGLGLQDAHRAGQLALVLGRGLRVFQRIAHLAALGIGVVVLAAQRAVVHHRRAAADAVRAGRLVTAVLGDLAGDARGLHAGVDPRAGVGGVVVQAGGRAPHKGRRIGADDARAAQRRRRGRGLCFARVCSGIVPGRVPGRVLSAAAA